MKHSAKTSVQRAFLCAVALASLAAAAPAVAGDAPEDMALVPAGEFLMGSSREEVAKVKETFGKRDMYRNHPFDAETPKHKVRLKAFYIDRHEVTNRQYADFIKATHYPPPLNWNGERYKSGFDDYPVLYVSQADAAAYATWAGKRLPTEEEWEKGARGADGRVFPWGNEFDPYKAATADSDMLLIADGLCQPGVANRVGIAKGDVSPYGVHDMAGNVREWTATVNPAEPAAAIVKGASWVDLYAHARAAYGEYVPRNARSHIIGFRCVRDVKE